LLKSLGADTAQMAVSTPKASALSDDQLLNLVQATYPFVAMYNVNNKAAIDLTQEPVIIEAPAFDSKYVSLMVTGYDHYVNIPMSTRQGHFSKPARILFYTEYSRKISSK
jgi:hypothetical protein